MREKNREIFIFLIGRFSVFFPLGTLSSKETIGISIFENNYKNQIRKEVVERDLGLGTGPEGGSIWNTVGKTLRSFSKIPESQQ